MTRSHQTCSILGQTKEDHFMSLFDMHPWRRSFLTLVWIAVLVSVAPAQKLKVTLLGTGSPQPRMDRFGPSILVEAGEKKLLFDCGRGVTQRIEQIRIPFTEIDALFLTHLHSDHIVGIPDLWLTGWARGRKVPLQVWGPAGTKEMMSHLKEAFQFDIQIRQDDDKLPARGVDVVAKDIEQGIVYDNGGIRVTAFTVDHGQVKPALGYRIDFAGHAVVLSGDTRFSENLIHFSEGTDVLIHEVIDPEGDTTNLLPLTRKTYSGPLEVGEDLMTIEIGEG